MDQITSRLNPKQHDSFIDGETCFRNQVHRRESVVKISPIIDSFRKAPLGADSQN